MDEKKIDNSVEEEDFAAMFAQSEKTLTRFTPGQKLTAQVIKISGEWVFIATGGKGEGVLDRKELIDETSGLTVKEGDKITVWFVSSKNGEMRFTTRLDGSGGGGSAQLEEAFQSGIPVQGLVEKEVKGGFEVKIGGSVRAFCPYSQMGLKRVENASDFVGTHLSFIISEYRDNGRSIVLSHRQILEEEQRAKREVIKEGLSEGDVVTGTVTSLRDFGAFVDIGGIEGLIPMSELAWGRVKSASDVLSAGEKVTVSIKQLDWEKNKVTLSLKATLADPWESSVARFPEGSYQAGTVSRLAPFGAFITLGEGIDGLIPISRLGSGRRISHPREVLKEGEQIEVKVENVDSATRRISLSPAEACRAVEEQEREMEQFRQDSAKSATQSLGSLGEMLKAKLKK